MEAANDPFPGTSLPSDLLWLRRLATLSLPIAAYSFTRTYVAVHGGFAHFDLLYQLACLTLLGGVCLAAWLERWASFALLAIVTQSISGYGALVYLLDRLLPHSMDHSLRHPEVIAWNLLSVVISTGIVGHLLRKYPMNFRPLERRMPVPFVLRAPQVGFLFVVIAAAVDLAPTFVRHIQQDGIHSHRCSRIWTDSAVVLAMLLGAVSGLLRRWRLFVSLGLVGQSIMAFRTLAGLVRGSLYADTSGKSVDFREFSQDLPVFAFAVFSIVYLAWRFPPDMQRAESV